MKDNFSEDFIGFADLSHSDLAAEELEFYIERASAPTDLRVSYDRHNRGSNLADVSKPHVLKLAETAVCKLYTLGLSDDGSGDSRVANLHRGLQVIRASDQFGPDRPHPTHRPETTFLDAYHRVLSAIDVRSQTRLQLQPQQELVQKTLFREIAASALQFTDGDEYTHRYTSHPRKAGRRITDVASPYWDFGMGTDDYPGKEFGSDGRGPNVTVWMPTGIIADQSATSAEQFDHLRGETWSKTTANGYVPARIAVQGLRMGVPSRGDQFDTANGTVKSFLEHAREA